MPFRIQCSAGHILVIPERWAGSKFHCPKCGAAVQVPGIAQDEAIVLDGDIDAMTLSTIPAATLSTVTEPTTPIISPTIPQPTPPRLAMDQQPAPNVTDNAPPLPSPAPSAIQPATPSVQAWEPDQAKRATALHLGMLVLAVAVFSVAPAAWEWMAIWQHPEHPTVPPWVYVSLLAGAVLFAYGIYVAQLPDWSTLWVATAALLLTAACYAALLANTLLGTDESSLVALLKFGDKLAGNRAVMWCFIMLALSSVTSYFLGHSAVRWYNAYRLLRQFQNR